MNLNETQLLAALDRASEPRKWAPSVVKRLPNISISSVGSACVRSLFFGVHQITEYNGIGLTTYPDYSTARGKRLMQFGYVIEDYVYKLFKKAGITISGTQDRVTDFNGRLVGKCDGIVSWPRRLVIEIKGLNNENYNAVLRNGMEKAFFNYHVQLNLYCFYFGIDRGMFVVVNKDNCDILVREIVMDIDLVTRVRRKVKYALDSRDPLALGKFNRKDQDCSFCPYVDICNSLPNETT